MPLPRQAVLAGLGSPRFDSGQLHVTIKYYDRDGAELPDVLEWAQLLENPAYRVVRISGMDGWRISTQFFGMFADNFWLPEGAAPLLFETMIFPPDGDPAEEDFFYQERYATVAGAEAGHERAVAYLLGKLGAAHGEIRSYDGQQVLDAEIAHLIDMHTPELVFA